MNQGRTPIIFLHRGSSSYLLCALWQAHHRNPDSEVILIGTWNPRLPFVTFVPIANFAGAAGDFLDVYVHLSTLGFETERTFMERWFIIDAYVKTRGFARFVHADSDLLFFCEADAQFPRFSGHRWALSRTSAFSGHLLFVSDPAILSEFCDYIMRMYLDPEVFGRMYRHYRWHRGNGWQGGVGDMAALTFFIEDGLGDPYQLNRIVDDSVFDHSINDARLSDGSEPFVMSEGRKKVVVESGQPWFVGVDGKMVRALSLHFQGGVKPLMRRYIESPSARLRTEYAAARLRERAAKRLDHASVMRRHYTGAAAKRFRRVTFGSQRDQ